MAINDFIISTLNVRDDLIVSIDTYKSSDKLHILIRLSDIHPTYPVVVAIKKRSTYTKQIVGTSNE